MRRVWLALCGKNGEVPARVCERIELSGLDFTMSADPDCGCPVLSNLDTILVPVFVRPLSPVTVTGFRLVGSKSGVSRTYTVGKLSAPHTIRWPTASVSFAPRALSFHLGH